MADKITPRTLKGFRDFPPELKIPRDKMIESIKSTFESFGFLPLETPALEYKEALIGDYGEDEKLMYAFTDHGGREVAMRFDLTVPLARFVAQNPQLTLPFKRYQIAPVWRGENTQAGRYREFYQCDADIIGADINKSDLEIITLTAKVLENLDIGKTIIRINNRKLYTCLIGKINIKEENQAKFLQKIDKINKIGLDGVISQIKELGISEEKLEPVKEFLGLSTKWSLACEQIQNFGLCEIGKQGFSELDKLFSALAKLGYSEDKIIFDPSVVRGLGYYTGTIFEANLDKNKEFGSIAGGGRYDNLTQRFTDKSLPAIGISFGIDRLLAALEKVRGTGARNFVAKVLVTITDNSNNLKDFEVAEKLRLAGIKSEIYSGESRDLSKQLKYSSNLNIPFAIIYGENESLILKDMDSGDQEEMTIEEIINKLK